MAKLYLFPSAISEDNIQEQLSAQLIKNILSLNFFIVESVKTARRFLRAIGYTKSFDEVTFLELNEHTRNQSLMDLIQPLLDGNNVGLLSDAGCPGVADPGADLIELVHQFNVEVIPLVGPSSILLALMASGLNGQSFAFNGYLPKEQSERIKKIKNYERIAKQNNQTQIFIETPYRNQHLFDDLVKHLDVKTRLCIASNLLANNQTIKTKSVVAWRNQKNIVQKAPTIFLFG